ncbi:grpE protein homolog 2, mitochondrial-like isoform X1 [Vitis riparia]|uniref:grpE protein homolog 2, mitochondrial-like isoform X1 n=1 Tax=Vitis riparia TaxID=96939 RepID=UPI00155AD3B1|nr:grpE protein homolog 2, mitochondrial-like isoform X1 [Vitis riparia]
MFASRVLFRSTRTLLAQGRTSSLLAPQSHLNTFLIGESTDKVVATQVSLLHHLVHNASIFQRFGISSSASPQTNEKETTQSGNEQGTVENDGAPADAEPAKTNQAEESGSNSKPQSESVKRRGRGTKRTAFSDSDSEGDLSMDDLMKLVVEKEELLKMKNKEIEKMQDKVLRSYAEMENVMERARREAENSKKFAIQNFAKSLLDVADNLGRASLVVKESFSKIDESKDTAGAVPLLKTLLEGVEMTEKQLGEVFRKFGMEKFDPTNEQFDPHRHNAAFQIPDPSKPSGTVAVVLKAGYMLHDRVIRPAEVGVTQAVDNNVTEA